MSHRTGRSWSRLFGAGRVVPGEAVEELGHASFATHVSRCFPHSVRASVLFFHGLGVRLLAVTGGLFLFVCLLPGCTRAYYRRQADRETYAAIAERLDDPRWAVPSVSIDPASRSRYFDPASPDDPPLPPDDPTAHRYMHRAGGIAGYERWHDSGDAASIESPDWEDGLELPEDGTLTLTPDRAVELGLLHSREYQSELEDLYSSALALTLERFEFDLHWFGGNDTTYAHSGTSSTPGESNTLATASGLGFSRALSRGGQLVIDFANSFVWEFTGPDVWSASSNLTINLIQPLLRRAGREVRLERLTQLERDVLYAVRDFARFRKQFYVNLTTGSSGYLSLLLQLQSIRNQEANLVSLEQNLRLHDAMQEAGDVSGIQVDQVFQSYQRGQLALLQAQSNFETALDSYKLVLGLPPTLSIQLDDSLLSPFQLTDPAINNLQKTIDKFLASYRELDQAPDPDRLRSGFETLNRFHDSVVRLVAQVDGELQKWQARIPEPDSATEDLQSRRERAASTQLARQLRDLPEELAETQRQVSQTKTTLSEATRTDGWTSLQDLTRQYIEVLAELFVVETQIRVHLITLKPVGYEEDTATSLALGNRFDLMNQQARVIDSWRKITVAADGLESDLDVVFDADIGTDPGGHNPVAFSPSANSYRLGLQFDAPLNRKAESNIYRTSLVNYQRARRSYMQLKDQIQQAVRRDLRQLETDRLNFEIARESLVAAARQVEQTNDQLVMAAAPGDSSTTQDVLNALNALLQAKNSLIAIWVSYERNRMQLLLDIESLQLNERGVYDDEHSDPSDRNTTARNTTDRDFLPRDHGPDAGRDPAEAAGKTSP